MKINIDDLQNLPQHRVVFPFNERLEGLAAIKPVVGELTLMWSSTGLKLVGAVHTLLKLQCDSCLRPYFQKLMVQLDERFVQPALLDLSSKDPQREPRELQKDDWVETIPDSGLLDISDVVYQAVTLATPTFCSCGDECPGPPLHSKSSTGGRSATSKRGDNSNNDVDNDDRPIDPRWKNLKTLFPNSESSENS